MKADQLYFVIIMAIAIYLILSSLDVGLTSVASKKTGSFVNGADVWTRVLFGVGAGMALAVMIWGGSIATSSSAGEDFANNLRSLK